ncbi:MAG: aldo/keto reductase [Coriobacteriia bacterium]|nr:aldo/keto reductase [Coriobacteriia bacterium]
MGFSLESTIALANGVQMPRFGLGTYKSNEGRQVYDAVTFALDAGYRSIDTASLYGNERSIGAALGASGVCREDVFLTSKVWNNEQGYDQTLAALDASLERLDTTYLDLYLVHWPIKRLLQPTWRAMEDALGQGKVRAIGVCNFMQHHLEALLEVAEVAPMLDQYELHPWLQQPSLRRFCKSNGIAVEAWAPLMRGRVGEVPELVGIADQHGVSPAQVSLRWLLQSDVVVIPKSVHAERIRANAGALDFLLSQAETAAIDSLDRGERLGRDPDDLAWNS